MKLIDGQGDLRDEEPTLVFGELMNARNVKEEVSSRTELLDEKKMFLVLEALV